MNFLIRLDLEKPSLQRTNIVLNKANKQSVTFNIRIYKEDTEIDYSQYSNAELVFLKPDKSNVVDDAILNSNGLTYALRPEISEVIGAVIGYVNLYTDDTITSSLHFSFMIISDLLNEDLISNTYVSAIERVLIEVRQIYSLIEGVLANAENITELAMDELREQIAPAIDRANQAAADVEELVRQAQEILNGLDTGTFATIEYVNNATSNMAVKDGTLQENLNAELLDGMSREDILASLQTEVSWPQITNTPNTLSGYGIVDAMKIQASLPAGSTNITDIFTQPSGYYIISSGPISGMPSTLNYVFGVLWFRSNTFPVSGFLMCSNLMTSTNMIYLAKVITGVMGKWETITASST